ncbi:MAG: 4Fe-4S binding protein [Candidatus Coproplasma sp.]
MKGFFTKVKNWFIAHKPTKRRLIQLYSALLTNANIKGFFTGKIYTGSTKKVCTPGLNCYACPGAVGACPLGALQDSLAQSSTRAPAYIFGILILFGLLLGRVICGFLCPFGLIQELFYKIRTPKLRKNRFTRVLSYFKYVVLALVIAIPLIYSGIPVFCKYLCPAGTLEGAFPLLANASNSSFFEMLGVLFSWKFCVLIIVIVGSIFIYRFLCRFICPLGAIYSLFCKISLLGVKLDKEKCINCGLCIEGCKMDIRHVGDHECIQCGECISVCPVQAITWKGSKIFLKNTTPVAQPAVAEGEKIPLLQLAKAKGATVYETTNKGEEASDGELNNGTLNNATLITQEPNGEKAEEQPLETTAQGKKNYGAKIKSAFKKPRFVVEFVAWVVATAVLIGAIVGYAVTGKDSKMIYGVGDKCPEFILQTYNSASDKTQFSTYTHDRVTVINFWFTTCDPCKEELPYFEAVYEEMKDEIDMYAVHSWSAVPPEGVQTFLDTQSDHNGRGWNTYELTFAQDEEGQNIYEQLGGKYAYPMTVVLDAKGYIVFRRDGTCLEQDLRDAIALAKSR